MAQNRYAVEALANFMLVACEKPHDAQAQLRMLPNLLAQRRSYGTIDCAVDGSGRWMVGRVAAYGPGGACYLCPRDAGEMAAIMREGSAGCPAWSWGRSAGDAAPTLSLPSVGAAVAGIAVT